MPDLHAAVRGKAGALITAYENVSSERWQEPPPLAKDFLPHVHEFYRIAANELADRFDTHLDASDSDVTFTLVSADRKLRVILVVTLRTMEGKWWLFQTSTLRRGGVVRYPGVTTWVEINEAMPPENLAFSLVFGTLGSLGVQISSNAPRADCTWPVCKRGACDGPCTSPRSASPGR